MAHLTMTEKEHWKTRIPARIDRSIETIQSKHPALFDRVKREAHALALDSFGVSQSYAEMENIQVDEIALARREERAQRTMVAALRGVPLESVVDSIEIRYGQEMPLPVEVAGAIAKRQAAHREQLLAEDPIGQELAGLRNERENLLDVIWLATSPAELRQLSMKVNLLLGDEPTQLERDTLSIALPKWEAARATEN
jgi:hypothetical protein